MTTTEKAECGISAMLTHLRQVREKELESRRPSVGNLLDLLEINLEDRDDLTREKLWKMLQGVARFMLMESLGDMVERIGVQLLKGQENQAGEEDDDSEQADAEQGVPAADGAGAEAGGADREAQS